MVLVFTFTHPARHYPPDDVDAEADEVINELNLLTEGEDSNLTENRKADGGDLFVGE